MNPSGLSSHLAALGASLLNVLLASSLYNVGVPYKTSDQSWYNFFDCMHTFLSTYRIDYTTQYDLMKL